MSERVAIDVLGGFARPAIRQHGIEVALGAGNMRYLRSICPALALLLSAGLTSASQSNAGPSVAAQLGYGATLSGGVNLLSFGLGLRAGYTCVCGLYAGALASLHIGKPLIPRRAQGLRGELGYELELPFVTLRPTLRAGAAWVTNEFGSTGRFVSPDLGFGLTLLRGDRPSGSTRDRGLDASGLGLRHRVGSRVAPQAQLAIG
jgi:hypothetical protein